MKPSVKTSLMRALVKKFGHEPYRDAPQLLVSVSGGLDSMVLLDVLVRMRHVHRAPIAVLYVHHHTGEFADLSWRTVKSYCQELEVPLLRRDFYGAIEDNFEAAASKFRRFVLRASCHPRGFCVLAHHAHDQVETFLQKLARGIGAASAPAMSENRDRRLRPFLAFSRDMLIDHAKAYQVPHVIDPANLDRQRFRTAIRHEVLPVFERFHLGFSQRAAAWLNDHQNMVDGIERDAAERFDEFYRDGVLARGVFECSPTYLWSFLAYRFWEKNGLPRPCRQDAKALETWLTQGETGSFDMGSLRVYCDLDGLTCVPNAAETSLAVRFGEEARWRQWRFSWDVVDNAQFGASLHDYRLEPNRSTPRPVKDYLRRQRIPMRLRQTLPAFVIGDRAFHFVHMLQLEQAGLLRSRWLQGPDPRHYFANLPRSEAAGDLQGICLT